MKDFSKKKRNLGVLPEDEKVLGTPEKGMNNANKEKIRIVKKAIRNERRKNRR